MKNSPTIAIICAVVVVFIIQIELIMLVNNGDVRRLEVECKRLYQEINQSNKVAKNLKSEHSTSSKAESQIKPTKHKILKIGQKGLKNN